MRDYLRLPNEVAPNPYDFYRKLRPWYRLVDPALADPAGKFLTREGGVAKAIKDAVSTAERFHTKCLDDYYHPNTYAFYGADPGQPAFGQVRWVGRRESGPETVLTTANVARARFTGYADEGGRRVDIEPGCRLFFQPEPPDASGDGTVPRQCGAAPADKVEHLFETRGYDHQGAFNDDDMVMPTLRLVVRMVQGLP